MSVTIKKVITKLVHISQINSGDTIIFKDKETTVTKKDIKYCELMGWTIFGDSYNLGYKFVTKVIKWI